MHHFLFFGVLMFVLFPSLAPICNFATCFCKGVIVIVAESGVFGIN